MRDGEGLLHVPPGTQPPPIPPPQTNQSFDVGVDGDEGVVGAGGGGVRVKHDVSQHQNRRRGGWTLRYFGLGWDLDLPLLYHFLAVVKSGWTSGSRELLWVNIAGVLFWF